MGRYKDPFFWIQTPHGELGATKALCTRRTRGYKSPLHTENSGLQKPFAHGELGATKALCTRRTRGYKSPLFLCLEEYHNLEFTQMKNAKENKMGKRMPAHNGIYTNEDLSIRNGGINV